MAETTEQLHKRLRKAIYWLLMDELESEGGLKTFWEDCETRADLDKAHRELKRIAETFRDG